MRVSLAQVNSTVGDLSGNSGKIIEAYNKAEKEGTDLVVFPELSLCGYPPEDLILKPSFIRDSDLALRSLAKHIKGPAAVIGFVEGADNQHYNAAAWLENGSIQGIYRKCLLPNYGVFDELRYFTPGHKPFVRLLGKVRVGVTICEDIWVEGPHWKELKKKSPHMIVNLSASPFHTGKLNSRIKTFRSFTSALKVPLVHCNAVGGQDELVFDGGSFALNTAGRVTASAPPFQEGVFTVDSPAKPVEFKPLFPSHTRLDGIEEVYHALILGVRDYVSKNRFLKVAIGLSGGIDSALVAAIATQALGSENVIGVTMPSRYNSDATISDAKKLADNLGIRFLSIPIQPIFTSFLSSLSDPFANTAPNEAEENLQARIRGSLLMALSNKFGWLILTTGNKSETSTGYCTLYGDTAGGFAVIKDVMKTTVYKLCHLINKKAGRELIPESIISRPPTAELRINQKDEDSLGSYSDLDPIIIAYVEENKSVQDIIRIYPEKETYIRKVISLIDRNEYKRRQAPPGIKITPRAFGRDHRMPITNRYRSS